MTVKVFDKGVRVFTVPSETGLGGSDQDYGNVHIRFFSADGEDLVEPHGVKFASSGKLGALTGGLLTLADIRNKPSRDDLARMNLEKSTSCLEKKRTRDRV